MKTVVRNTTLLLKQGDITLEKADAIVNAANSMLAGGGGVDGAIHSAGGPKIAEECAKIMEMQGGCPTGEAVITSGGKLPARYVIHTVGPIYQGGTQGEEELLRSCYRNSLRLAVKTGIYFIAFPSVSTGVYGYPTDRAAKAALGEVLHFLSKDRPGRLRQVTFVLFSDEDLATYEEALKDLSKRYSLKIR